MVSGRYPRTRRVRNELKTLKKLSDYDAGILRQAKELGFSDRHMASLSVFRRPEFRKHRLTHGVRAVFKTVDTCGAEFEAATPYLYSTYETECEAEPTTRRKIMILGGGPNRIGQGIEFDYCCVHASFALKEIGFESIMVNCNPETVSTDYDTSDRLYFEPLTFEDVMNIVETEKPDGVIVQFGGQTPLKLADALEKAGVKIFGTSPASIDLAEDRKLFDELSMARAQAARQRNGHVVRRNAANRTTAWISDPRAAVICVGRAGHGNRLRRIGPEDCVAKRWRFPKSTRSWSTSFSKTPPSSMSMPSATASGS